tara:strand:+ start:1551 stop:2033 length:483 start_codon:yes stop_codon:yes gene_type:complete
MKIIDDVLNRKDFDTIKQTMLGINFSWFYTEGISEKNINDEYKDYYLTHMFLYDYQKSAWFDMLNPIFKILDPIVMRRVKGNMYPSTPEIVHHNSHTDAPYKHKGAIFYVNTNNGFTVLHDGTKVQSIENRLLLFDASLEHHSTSCTDENTRVNININYF